ncbi:MAG: hypothetical protein K2L34_14860 [Muribaculaceae bacterium]|nr:hypothetical protein [Muribaculaceae bacterium]
MKKYFIATIMSVCAFVINAQTINFSNGGVTYSFPAATAGEMVFDGENVTVADRIFDLNVWSQMNVTDNEVEANTVEIGYSATGASVTVSGNIARYVDVTLEGAHVTVTQSSDVSETTCGEITYVLKGESMDGSLTLNGSYKSTVELRGLTLVNPAGAVLDIQNGKVLL